MHTADTLADLLETLVNTPSVTGNEREIADLVADRLSATRRGEIVRSGRSVIWRGPAAGRPLLVLAGHLDTVPPNGNAAARREGARVYGVGATDMKAGDAVMLALVESLDPASLRFDLACVFYDGEEGPATGNALGRLFGELPWLREAALAILLEPTANAVELGCNGVLNVEVRVAGVAAHSARPWTGENAIQRAADWLARITRFETVPHEVSGVTFHETLQVTTLRAGQARNVVPDELIANLNYRFPPSVSMAEAERRVRALVPDAFGFTVVDRAEPGLVSLDQPEVTTFVRRFAARVAGKQGWTDVARFSSAGVPAFNFGPGIPELCHQANEYCEIDALETAYRWLSEFLREPGDACRSGA